MSSTAHLILFPWFFGWGGELDTLTFDVGLHGGTLCALLVCFYRDWADFLVKDRQTLLFIAIATIPALAAGYFLHDFVEHALRSPQVIVPSLVVFGGLMLAAEKYHARNPHGSTRARFTDSLTIGFAQAIALVPGVSRSGITITAGLFRNLTRQAAARFSFLLSTPIIAVAVLYKGYKLLKDPEPYHLDVFAAGAVAAFVSGLLAIKFLLSFLKEHRLNVFVYYRFALAAVIVLAWAGGQIVR